MSSAEHVQCGQAHDAVIMVSEEWTVGPMPSSCVCTVAELNELVANEIVPQINIGCTHPFFCEYKKPRSYKRYHF